MGTQDILKGVRREERNRAHPKLRGNTERHGCPHEAIVLGIDLEKINLNHISWEGDMLIIYFTHGKTDQQRKKLRKTRIKGNHEMPHICCVTALTVYLMTRAHDGLELFEGGAVNICS